MRWGIRDPGRRFADRFVLGAGHTIPLVHCTLAVLNEALRSKHGQTGDPRYLVKDGEHKALYWEHCWASATAAGFQATRRCRGGPCFSSLTPDPRATAARPPPASWPDLATANPSEDPESEFRGFWSTTSTHGCFSYLLYGMARLFSQLAQDCEWKLGKVFWVAFHSGPETAADSRTHFGIFAARVTQSFPRGQIINLHPWEFNEVPVRLAAAPKRDVPVVALHLTRPEVEIPEHEALGMPSHFEAPRGAYVVRDADPARPRGATVIVQGTSAAAAVIRILPDLAA